MFLPRGDRAFVPIEKLRDYCLNPNHPVCKHKARVFETALGFTAGDVTRLERLLLDAAHTQEAELGEQDEFGQRYIVDFTTIGVTELVTIRSSWIIRTGEDAPQLVTCFVL